MVVGEGKSRSQAPVLYLYFTLRLQCHGESNGKDAFERIVKLAVCLYLRVSATECILNSESRAIRMGNSASVKLNDKKKWQ